MLFNTRNDNFLQETAAPFTKLPKKMTVDKPDSSFVSLEAGLDKILSTQGPLTDFVCSFLP